MDGIINLLALSTDLVDKTSDGIEVKPKNQPQPVIGFKIMNINGPTPFFPTNSTLFELCSVH